MSDILFAIKKTLTESVHILCNYKISVCVCVRVAECVTKVSTFTDIVGNWFIPRFIHSKVVTQIW